MLPSSSAPTGGQASASTAASRTIHEGDLVVVYESPICMKPLHVSAKGQFENKYGVFRHQDWLGLPYGVKVASRSGRGFVHLLAPTPELWTTVLRHRTQILYTADISLICFYLELHPGCVVLESGTGSGSLTHALARAVAPSGHVHTFEFHPGRAEEAAAEFKAHGLASFITVQQRNIEDLGFPADMAGKADGVFLDLPRPQKVVASAAACLRPDGRFCSFSPCIEQVQRTAEALEAHGFVDVQMVECLLRNYVVKAERLSANVVGGPPPAGHTGAGKAQGSGRKRARPDDEPEGDGEDGSVAVLAAEAGEAAGGEAQAMAQGDAAPAAGAGGTQQGHAAVTAATGTAAAVAGQKAPAPQAQPQPVMAVLAYPEVEARGHTGYLLFARKFVRADGTGATIATAAPATGADEVPAETPADTPAAAATNAEPSISCEVPSNDGQ